MKLTHNEKALLALIAVIVVVAGAYVLFQLNGTPTPQNTATTTPPTTTTSPGTSGKIVLPVKPTPTAPTPSAAPGSGPGVSDAPATISTDASGFNATIDTRNATVGSMIPQIVIGLPKNSYGKLIVITLEPTSSSSQIPPGILLMTPANSTNDSYSITGLRFTDLTNETTGAKFKVIPGTYRISTTLWDKNPYPALGGSVAGNNGISVRSAPFTVSAAP